MTSGPRDGDRPRRETDRRGRDGSRGGFVDRDRPAYRGGARDFRTGTGDDRRGRRRGDGAEQGQRGGYREGDRAGDYGRPRGGYRRDEEERGFRGGRWGGGSPESGRGFRGGGYRRDRQENPVDRDRARGDRPRFTERRRDDSQPHRGRTTRDGGDRGAFRGERRRDGFRDGGAWSEQEPRREAGRPRRFPDDRSDRSQRPRRLERFERAARRDGQRRPAPDGERRQAGQQSKRDGEHRPEQAPPTLPEDILATELDPEARAELLSLAKPVAETVARHLVATGKLIDEEPQKSLAHALAARRLASRIASVREAVGLAAYRAGEWQTAIAELRTYHRMTGRQTHLAVVADSERALGRPERAVDLYRGADRKSLDRAEFIELLIVAAGARRDMGQGDAAVAMLQVRELTAPETESWAARLRYAYADALLAVGRREEAREWFARAVDADVDGETDASERLLELDGVLIEGDDLDDDVDDAAYPDSAWADAAAEPGPDENPVPGPAEEVAGPVERSDLAQP